MVEADPGGTAAARYCSSCGNALTEGGEFCGQCGAPTGSQAGGSSTPASPAVGYGGRSGHIKYRNMVAQVFLVIITFGIYAIYWYHVTLGELHIANRKTEGAGMWTFLSIIPILSLFAYWHHAEEYSEFVGGRYPGIGVFILWLVFSPIVWFLVQSDLNRAAQG